MEQAITALVRQALSEKALVWAALLASFAAWGATVADPAPWRIAAASAFTVLVYLPLVWRSR
jgi:hypothetical protein